MRCARGQGTVEYLAVVLLVALVFAGTATAAAGAGGEIGSSVTRELHRALCIVRGGDCDRDLAPCDVSSDSSSKQGSFTIAVLKLGGGKTVTVVRRSDDTFAVTLHKSGEGGVETAVGARGGIRLGDRRFAAGADITAGFTGSYGRGRTWIARSEAEARTMVGVLDIDADAMPPADIEGHDGSLDVGANASAGSGVNGSAGVGARLEGGHVRDRRTGNRTYFFTAGVSGQAELSAGDKAKVSANGSDQDRYALTIDRDGRWLDLTVTRTGALSGDAGLPEELASIAERLDVPTSAARRWVSESHLDLTDSRSLAAAQAVVARVKDPRHPEAMAAALVALSRRMAEAAVVDTRAYAVDTDGFGVGGHIAAELKFGANYEQSTESMRLLAARTRGIDGRWRDRRDCLQKEA